MSTPEETERLVAYLDKPTSCPFCKSGDINADRIEGEAEPVVECYVTCRACGRGWVELYRLFALREQGRDGKTLVEKEKE